MADLESTSHSFVVKIWIEDTAEEAGQTLWRGHVTHVPSRERRYFQDFETMLAFMKTYLRWLSV
ncbi:MAG TPA: hypothetical protein VL334_07635 [Anaerolineae bacterium]|nr:hypothetical protein [Anaerolineae bacterium]